MFALRNAVNGVVVPLSATFSQGAGGFAATVTLVVGSAAETIPTFEMRGAIR